MRRAPRCALLCCLPPPPPSVLPGPPPPAPPPPPLSPCPPPRPPPSARARLPRSVSPRPPGGDGDAQSAVLRPAVLRRGGHRDASPQGAPRRSAHTCLL